MESEREHPDGPETLETRKNAQEVTDKPKFSVYGRDASSAFLGFLIAIAYQNATGPAESALLVKTPSIVDVALLVSFCLLGLGTFISGYFNLALFPSAGVAWFVNFLILVVEGVILMFMGYVVTATSARSAGIGFDQLLLAFFFIEAVWNAASWLCYPGARGTTSLFAAAALVAVAAVAVISLVLSLNSHGELLTVSGIICAFFVAQVSFMVKRNFV